MIRQDRALWARGESETAMREDYDTPAEPFVDSDNTDASVRRAMLLLLLRGRWHWAILLAILLGVVGGYLGYNSQPVIYEADSTIEIEPDYDRFAVDVADYSLNEAYVNFVNGEIRRLYSLEVIESAMDQSEWRDNLGRRPDRLEEITVDGFASAMDIDSPEKDDTRIKVAFFDEDPRTASAGLNALLQAYRDIQKQDRTDQIEYNRQLLFARKAKLEKEARDTRALIEEFVSADERQLIHALLTRKLGELANMEFELGEIDFGIGFYLDEEGNLIQASVRELMLEDEGMIELLGQKNQLEENLAYLIEVLERGEEMADVRQTRRMIARIDRLITEFEADWLEASDDLEVPLPAGLAQLRSRRDAVLKRIELLNAETTDISRRLNAIKEYELALENNIGSIRHVVGLIDQLDSTIGIIDENEEVSRIIIGSSVTPPTTPYNEGKRRQLAGVGGIAGFFMGFGLVIAAGLMDRRLRHVSDTAAGMPDANVLGILPTLPADMKNPEEAETAAHCVHHIRTLLQIGGANRVFSITSPAAGSGKSSLATALGMSFAASGARTLVVDADLVGAGLSRRMGTVVHEPIDVVIRKHGLLGQAELANALTQATAQDCPLDQVLLSEQLLDQEQVETAIRLQRDTSLGLLDACAPERLRACVGSTDIENFYILPVGRARPSDASKLSPTVIRELIRQAREAFDIVLIDTGPVLGSLEASIAAAESDATVLVVSRGDQKSLATRSLAQLRSVRAQIAGLVFNHALERDLTHLSYASVVSQERRPDRSVRKRRLDKTRSARLGPLGTAVASYTEDDAASNGSVAHNGQDFGED